MSPPRAPAPRGVRSAGASAPGRALVAALALLLAGCAAPGPGADPSASFAPALAVDLATMTRTPSGLHYRDLAVGEGEPARAGLRVAVRYVAWLPDGTQVDANVAPAAPMEFRLGTGRVIRGWDEGIPGMRAGGQRQLVVPPHLGYGTRAGDDVPRNSTLVFLIELVSVEQRG